MITINGPDGNAYNFPDGTDRAVIVGAMTKKFPKTPKPDNTQFDFSETPQVTSQGLGLKKALKQPLDNAAVWMESGLRKAGVPVDRINKMVGAPSAEQAREATRQDVQAEAKKGVRPGFGGEMLGTVVSGAPLALVTRNPLLLGGAQGAINTDKDTVEGVANDATVGAAMGGAGSVAVRAAGAATSPVWRQSVNRMLNQRVALTPGQIIGGTAHRMEDAAVSLPVLGDFINRAHIRGNESLTDTMISRALAPIGERIEAGVVRDAAGNIVQNNVAPGHQSIAYVQKRLGDLYDQLAPHMNITQDRRFVSSIRNLQNLTRGMPRDHREMFDNMLHNEVLGRFAAGGQMSGVTMKEADSILGDEARQFINSANPHDRRYADAIREVQRQLRMTAARQNPAASRVMRAVDAGYRQLTTAERAVAPTKQGIVVGSDVRRASLVDDRSVRKRASAAGRGNMQDLAVDAEDTLTPTIKDSGTTTRAAINGLAAGGVYGMTKYGLMSVSPLGAAAVASTVLPYTRTGGNIVRNAMMPRPRMMPVRRGIQRAAPVGALAGSAPTTSHPVQEVNE